MTIHATSPAPSPAPDTAAAPDTAHGAVEVASVTFTVALEADLGASRGDIAHARSVYASALARLRGAFDVADAAIAQRGGDVRLTLSIEPDAGR